MKSLSIVLIVIMIILGSFVVAEEDVVDEVSEESVSSSVEETGFSAQDSFDWLVKQIDSDGSIDGDVTKTALAIMALDAAGYDVSVSQAWLGTQLSSDFCYPGSACTVTETSLSVLALNEVQDDSNFEDISSWYISALSDADVTGSWYLEVVTSADGTCVVSYELEGTLQEIEVPVSGGVFTGCGSSHFLDLDECLQAGLISSNPGMSIDVNCAELEGSVVLAHVYKSASTYYLLANENAAQADFQINNGCFGKSVGSACDVETTLYANWALGKLDSTINTLVYLKENYDDSSPKRAALMYLVTKDESYLVDLASLQKSDGSFDRDHYVTALAILALSESSAYSTNVEDAKSYLREEQAADGGWGGSVENTALILYAAFSGDDVSASTISVGGDDEIVSECDTSADCEIMYGSGYACDDGSCVYSGFGCNTDADCSTGEACVDSSCVASDCDNGVQCGSADICCDYPNWNENVYNCPSDCYCGDGICDDVESDASSGDDYYCAEDCGGEEEEEEKEDNEPECSSNSDCSSGKECSFGNCVDVKDEGGSGFIVIVIVLLLLIGLGVGGYFAYKKGYLDEVINKFKKGGGKGPSVQSQSAYNPFTSRLPPQQNSFGGAQQPKRPF